MTENNITWDLLKVKTTFYSQSLKMQGIVLNNGTVMMPLGKKGEMVTKEQFIADSPLYATIYDAAVVQEKEVNRRAAIYDQAYTQFVAAGLSNKKSVQ